MRPGPCAPGSLAAVESADAWAGGTTVAMGSLPAGQGGFDLVRSTKATLRVPARVLVVAAFRGPSGTRRVVTRLVVCADGRLGWIDSTAICREVVP